MTLLHNNHIKKIYDKNNCRTKINYDEYGLKKPGHYDKKYIYYIIYNTCYVQFGYLGDTGHM